jgi:hypothetical protein
MFQKGFEKVSKRFQKGFKKVSKKFQKGSKKVSKRFQTFQQRFKKVPIVSIMFPKGSKCSILRRNLLSAE